MPTSPLPDTAYWVAFNRCPKLGPTRFASLRQAFTTMQTAWSASINELIRAGLEPALAQAIDDHRKKTDVTESWAQVEKLGLSVITIVDGSYPPLLKEIYDPPPLLYVKGSPASLQKSCLAVVGSRRATNYGIRLTESLVPDLAVAGLTIVSGLAYGIDAAAHRACLSVGGTTVAVLACGLDIVYPLAHIPLAQEVEKSGGAVISEFAPGTAPLKQNFPFRNRIIAGLSRGTLVIEAGEGSGALLTAKHALEANREIFAVPGSALSEASVGPNDLLRQGAHVVTSARHVLDVLGMDATARPKRLLRDLTPEQTGLLDHLSSEPSHINDVIRSAGLSPAQLIPQLTLLELAGYVKEVEPQKYVKL